jgi:hypothetical protein
MRWPDVPVVLAQLLPDCHRAQTALRKVAASFYPQAPVGYYFEPIARRFGAVAEADDWRIIKQAASSCLRLRAAQVEEPHSRWVKLAYRLPLTRRSSQPFVGPPVSPWRLTAALLSGLTKAAAGYGDLAWPDAAASADPPPLAGRYLRAVRRFVAGHTEKTAGIGVNINALGQTLWEGGASPQLAASTMSTMYAAQQMPDSRSRPGLVTGHQLGQLAAGMIGSYATGLLAAAALQRTLQLPSDDPKLQVGVIGSVVPKLFGE